VKRNAPVEEQTDESQYDSVRVIEVSSLPGHQRFLVPMSGRMEHRKPMVETCTTGSAR